MIIILVLSLVILKWIIKIKKSAFSVLNKLIDILSSHFSHMGNIKKKTLIRVEILYIFVQKGIPH